MLETKRPAQVTMIVEWPNYIHVFQKRNQKDPCISKLLSARCQIYSGRANLWTLSLFAASDDAGLCHLGHTQSNTNDM